MSGGAKNIVTALESLLRKSHVRRCVPSPNRCAPLAKRKIDLGSLPLALLELLLHGLLANTGSYVLHQAVVSGFAYQSLRGAVERMPVVPAELGVGAVQRGVPLGLGLLDAVVVSRLASPMRC